MLWQIEKIQRFFVLKININIHSFQTHLLNQKSLLSKNTKCLHSLCLQNHHHCLTSPKTNPYPKRQQFSHEKINIGFIFHSSSKNIPFWSYLFPSFALSSLLLIFFLLAIKGRKENLFWLEGWKRALCEKKSMYRCEVWENIMWNFLFSGRWEIHFEDKKIFVFILWCTFVWNWQSGFIGFGYSRDDRWNLIMSCFEELLKGGRLVEETS